ncbi:unnamed protein product [Closterium sp. NIES-53]
MVRPLSKAWKHAVTETGPDGSVTAKCKHCGKPVTASATRIEQHVFGTPSQKEKNVTPCDSDVAKQLRVEAEQDRSSVGPSNRASCSTTVEILAPRRARQRDIRDMANTTARSRLDYLWAGAVAENDWAFQWLVCVIALNDTAPVIVETVDSKTAKKTGVYLAGLLQKAICKVGDKAVVQVVMDNVANNRRAADILREGYPSIFFNNCAAHVLDLMLHDLWKIRAVKRVLSQVRRVVMMVKGSASAVTLFHEVFSELALVRPGATRFGTNVIMLTRFLEVKKALRQMVISEEWEGVAVAKQDEGKAVRFLLLDEVFWDCATAVLAILQPVYDVLRVVDTRALVMGQVYGLMLEATVKTNEAAKAGAAMLVKRTSLLAAKDTPSFLAAIKAIIAKRWDGQLHNPLHALGWLLNPRNQYLGEVREDQEVISGAEEVIQARGGDVAQRTLIQAQLAQFHKGEGRLGSPDARWAAKVLVEGGRLTDAEWWWMYGGEVQALQALAVMTLSQPVTSSEVERYWSAIARVQRRDRNRISAKKMMDVTYKLYTDLSNGTLKEGCVVAPAEAEVEEEEEEEEGEENVGCTIDWDNFAQIGKKKKKVGKSSKRKRNGTAAKPCKGKGKAKAVHEGEEEEAADNSGQEEEDVPTNRTRRTGADPWDIRFGSSGEEEEEEDKEEEEVEEEEEEVEEEEEEEEEDDDE